VSELVGGIEKGRSRVEVARDQVQYLLPWPRFAAVASHGFDEPTVEGVL